MIVGVLGGGQLARMLALAGHPLDIKTICLDPAADACAAPVAAHLHGEFNDHGLLARLAERADVVTYEFENVPLDSVRILSQSVAVYPPPQALEATQDRLHEKSLFRQLGIATPDYAPVGSLDELQQAVADIGLPAVLKTRRMGYDGKGQALLRRAEDLAPAWQMLGGVPAILEAFVPFEREVSIIAVRGRGGEIAVYPLSENTHQNGILRLSQSRSDDAMQTQAQDAVSRLLTALDYVGVLALELFQVGDKLLANEFAPRVHNSGHWTIEGAETSQFENHLRAVLGLPLGSTAAVGRAAMVNFIGDMPKTAAVLALPGVHLHAYGKVPKPGRKVGHATVRSDSQEDLEGTTASLLALAPVV